MNVKQRQLAALERFQPKIVKLNKMLRRAGLNVSAREDGGALILRGSPDHLIAAKNLIANLIWSDM